MKKIRLFVLFGMSAMLLSIVNQTPQVNGGMISKDSKSAQSPETVLEKVKGDETINTESAELSAKEYMEAYAAFLGDFIKLSDYDYNDFALRDLDNNGVPELIITQVDQVDGVLNVYSYHGSVYQIGTHSDPKIGVSALRTSDNPELPGLFNHWWGGGVEHYGYLSVQEETLIYEDLWYIDRTGELPYQNEISENKELTDESKKVFSDDEYTDNMLETYPINDEITTDQWTLRMIMESV